MEEYYIYIGWSGHCFDHFNPYRIWLNENIGRQNWQFYGAGSMHPNTIRFETGADALAFKLKFNL